MVDPNKMEAFVNEGGGEAPPEMGGEAEEGGGEEKYTGLIPLLIEFAEDVQDSIDELDPSVLEDTASELGPDDSQILGEAMAAMDKGLSKELSMGPIPPEDADFIAQSVVDAGAYDEDPARLSGWLQRASAMLGGAPPEEGEEMPEEGGEEEAPPEE